MSGEPPEGSSIAPLVEALEVRRSARLGFGAAAAVAVLVFVVFVLLPETTLPAAYFVALAFVLAVSLGGFLTLVLVAVRAARLAREP